MDRLVPPVAFALGTGRGVERASCYGCCQLSRERSARAFNTNLRVVPRTAPTVTDIRIGIHLNEEAGLFAVVEAHLHKYRSVCEFPVASGLTQGLSLIASRRTIAIPSRRFVHALSRASALQLPTCRRLPDSAGSDPRVNALPRRSVHCLRATTNYFLDTLENYEQDCSANQRSMSWTMNWNLAKTHPLSGAGFQFDEINDPRWLAFGDEKYLACFGEVAASRFCRILPTCCLLVSAQLKLTRLRRQANRRKKSGWIWHRNALFPRIVTVPRAFVLYATGGAFSS
jgi:hypothetical protein